MLTIRKADVPSYLHYSDLYANLNDDANDSFCIAEKHFKRSAVLSTQQDLHHLLSTLSFWGSNIVVGSLAKYIDTHDIDESDACLKAYLQEMPYIKALIDCKKASSIDEKFAIAVSQGEILAVRYICKFARRTLNKNLLVECRRDPGRYCVLAVKHGRLECLKFLEEQGIHCDFKACLYAAEGGHLTVLQYLHQKYGYLWKEEVCNAAAMYGHTACLKYAHEHGCPWNHWTTFYAAQGNHLDCLKYAYEHGCPWTSATCTVSINKGHFACLEYASSHGCPVEYIRSVDYVSCWQSINYALYRLFSNLLRPTYL